MGSKNRNQKWRILLVEDDPAIGEPLKELLEFEGYDINWHSSARLALDELRAEGEIPHLILLDIMMPEMNGWEFREAQIALDSSASEVPVFILSADRRAESRVDPSKREYFFPKPIDMDELADQIELKLSHFYAKN